MQTLAQYLQTQYNAAHYSSLIQQNAYSFDWFARLASDKTLHPIITKILDAAIYPAADLAGLIGEYPHISRDDAQQIAYCQSEDKAKRGIYTRGKIGRYITRHFPTMPENAIRGIVSHSLLQTRISIVDTIGAFLHTVTNGPSSCMASRSFDVHPYNCYSPKFGWRMAVRRESDGRITGRALLNSGVFVRAYTSTQDGGYCADTELQDYLKGEGYEHVGAWPKGTRLALLEDGGRIVAPYIDGSRDRLNVRDGYLQISDSGEYGGDETGGYASGQDDDDDDDEDMTYCQDCDDRISYDDSYSVGIDQDRTVCGHCCNRSYTCVEITRRSGYGRQYSETYYVPDDECIRVDGTSYHQDNLPDEIVCLHDGDYAHIDNCVHVESAGEYYLCDDSAIVQLENGDYELRDDAWQCAYSAEWYSDGADSYETGPDGEKVHPDNWREYCTEILGQTELEFDAMTETT